ncbi:MAG: hypothetical protein IJU33_02155 [Bacteroidales bacterium]|nr:hypothetical protein [Bacteroidales bacterium]
MKKLGRLKLSVARAINVKCANICISDSYIVHIANTHKKELEQVGMSAIDYAQFVVDNYNQIRKGSGDSILLVVYNKELSHTAAIALNYSLKSEFWEVKTAEPRRQSEIVKRKLLWRDCPSPE